MLLEKGVAVRGSDIVENKHPGIEFVKGDLRKLDDVLKACDGVDTVFHIAAAPYKVCSPLFPLAPPFFFYLLFHRPLEN